MSLHQRFLFLSFYGGLATVLIAGRHASAVPVTLFFDPDSSSITLSGDFQTAPLIEQAPNSATTSYSGSITVDVDNRLAPSTIEILGSSAVAAINGTWLPEAGGGPAAGDPGTAAPGNYGLALDVGVLGMAFAAVREVEFDITSGVEAVTGGQFASTQSLTTVSGFFDVNAPPALASPPSRDDLSGDVLMNMAAAASSYSASGSEITLEIPIDIVDADDLTVVYTGTLVARVPEPTGAVLIVMTMGPLFVRRRR